MWKFLLHVCKIGTKAEGLGPAPSTQAAIAAQGKMHRYLVACPQLCLARMNAVGARQSPLKSSTKMGACIINPPRLRG